MSVDEDAPCGICGVSEHAKGNDMIFCDACNTACHMQCVNLERIPSGTWICPVCDRTSGLDDALCGVCGQKDCDHENPFVFCDLCDEGYHVRCIGLTEHPREESWWCCKECAAQDEASESQEVHTVRKRTRAQKASRRAKRHDCSEQSTSTSTGASAGTDTGSDTGSDCDENDNGWTILQRCTTKPST